MNPEVGEPRTSAKTESPLVRALLRASERTTAEIRVHVSHRKLERVPGHAAQQVFKNYGMSRTAQRNAVLLYINVVNRTHAVVADRGATEALSPEYWRGLSAHLAEDLQSTYYENAAAIAVETLALSLEKAFPPLR